jgi:hypothetical protein
LSNVRDIVLICHMNGLVSPKWNGFIIKERELTVEDDGRYRSETFNELITRIVERVKLQNYQINKIYVKVGPLTLDERDEWMAKPRIVKDTVFIIDSLDDDSAFALMLLSLT